MTEILVGIDGGGTSCRAAVADADGRVLGRAKSGSANILTAPDEALANIVAAAEMAFTDAGLDKSRMADAHAVLGLAGANAETVTAYIRARLPFAAAEIVSDGLIALQGALGDGDGAIAILGTGSVFLARSGDRVRSIGGWGFIISDLGSGARLGHALIQEAALVHDRIHTGSGLTTEILAEFGDDPRRIVEFARSAKPADFARFAPRLFEHAASGDTVAVALLKEAALSVDEALDALDASGSERLCLLGGLAPLYAEWLAEGHRALLVEAEADALAGAVALARTRFGQTVEALR